MRTPFEKWWYYGPSPYGRQEDWAHRSRAKLTVERADEIGLALLFRPKRERGYSQTHWDDERGGYRLVKNTSLFELTLHLLLWRMSFWVLRAKEHP